MPVERVREILKISQEPVSLETPIGEEEDSHLGDFIQDDNVPVPADAAAFTLLKEQLVEVLSTLTEYLAPMFYSPCGLFYNAGFLKEKGWDVPKTWEAVVHRPFSVRHQTYDSL